MTVNDIKVKKWTLFDISVYTFLLIHNSLEERKFKCALLISSAPASLVIFLHTQDFVEMCHQKNIFVIIKIKKNSFRTFLGCA